MPVAKKLYRRVMETLQKPRNERKITELLLFVTWFRESSKVLNELDTETLLDVIQHCDFVSYNDNECIIHQGEKGHRFYIILRGQVSVLHRDAYEDMDLGEEGQKRRVDISTLGNLLVQLGEGATFGEIALINPDCIRTASVVADEKTDLVVIHRDLYNRSVSKVVAKLFQEKIDFVESLHVFSDWSQKWKKMMAVSLKKEIVSFDSPLIKQGATADRLIFILSGEVKITVDPEAHYRQFERYMSKCEVLDCHDDDIERERAYFPQKFLPQLYRCSRINRMTEIARPGTAGYRPMKLPSSWSPSAIRKMNQQISAKKINLNMCFLGPKQSLGDVEFILNLNNYYTTARCTQETVVMCLTKVHFDRLFRRRNPRTVKMMCKSLELQLTRRAMKPNIIMSVPLLKCFIFRLQQEFNSDRKSGEEIPFSIPEFQLRSPKIKTSPSRDNLTNVDSVERTPSGHRVHSLPVFSMSTPDGNERAAALAAATTAAKNIKEAAEQKEIDRQLAIEEAYLMRKSSSMNTNDFRKKLSACKSIHLGSNMTLDTLPSQESQTSYYGPPDNLAIPVHMVNQQPVAFIALSSLSRSQYLMECRSNSTLPSTDGSSSNQGNSFTQIQVQTPEQHKAKMRPKSSTS